MLESSRQEGRKDRQRGVEVAKLALVSLEGGDQIFGDRIHDLRALGWAWVGNAHRLAFDFPAASAAFEQAEREWALPRAQPDRLVLAHICLRKGALRLMQREFAQATEDLNCSCALFRQSEQTEDEALALIERATMHGYAGRLHDAVEDLREAEGLVDESEDKELAFAVRGNLANALVRASQAESAAAELSSARRLALELDDPLGAIQLDWIEGDLGELRGDLEQAKRCYLVVREGYREAGDPRSFSKVSVDLMSIHARLGDWHRVEELASETLPMLGSLELHRETIAAVRLLTEALEARGLSSRLLDDLRVALRRDPLLM